MDMTDVVEFDRVHRLSSRPDSPVIACCTFYKQKGHVTKAQRVLCMIARWNGRNPPNLNSVQALCSDSDHTQRKFSYFHIFSTWRMMKISCLLGFMWFCCSIAYFGILFGITKLSWDFNLNFFLMTVVELPTPLFVYHMSGCLMAFWVSSSVGAGSSNETKTGCLSEEEAGKYVNALCIVCRAALILAWNVMSLFTAELYPTVVRLAMTVPSVDFHKDGHENLQLV
ncbi:solute carrier family 22 member 7-like [Babylonia areolata]|uniref:solute carrier family 22 member 7-like n=1 Tax=Babylonia areolata TaxID=304850 RepID=UPI003FD15466